ncbi:MAG: hypothetical protein JSR86_08585 [Proteobacteria bacterium]|nr:hypothetical protein [Pseudomonadota bacterium]
MPPNTASNLQQNQPTSLTPDQSRVVARISSDYFLRTLALMAEFHGGDIIKAIVFQAVVAANTSHLDQAGDGARFSGIDSAPPDEMRRPVSALAISQALGMPFETTRRYVNRLLAEGMCVRVRKGVIAPQSVVRSPEGSRLTAINHSNVRRFVRELNRAGVVLD